MKVCIEVGEKRRGITGVLETFLEIKVQGTYRLLPSGSCRCDVSDVNDLRLILFVTLFDDSGRVTESSRHYTV